MCTPLASFIMSADCAVIIIIIIIIYFLADALIQGDLQLLQDITLFLHTITLFFYIQLPIYTVGLSLEKTR